MSWPGPEQAQLKLIQLPEVQKFLGSNAQGFAYFGQLHLMHLLGMHVQPLLHIPMCEEESVLLMMHMAHCWLMRQVAGLALFFMSLPARVCLLPSLRYKLHCCRQTVAPRFVMCNQLRSDFKLYTGNTAVAKDFLATCKLVS